MFLIKSFRCNLAVTHGYLPYICFHQTLPPSSLITNWFFFKLSSVLHKAMCFWVGGLCPLTINGSWHIQAICNYPIYLGSDWFSYKHLTQFQLMKWESLSYASVKCLITLKRKLPKNMIPILSVAYFLPGYSCLLEHCSHLMINGKQV